jgi:hypothetical protein
MTAVHGGDCDDLGETVRTVDGSAWSNSTPNAGVIRRSPRQYCRDLDADRRDNREACEDGEQGAPECHMKWRHINPGSQK